MIERTVCLHFHIFKNAGTTIDWILKRNFGDRAAFLDDNSNPSRRLSMEIVLEYLRKHPETRSVSSHQLQFAIPKGSEFHFLSMVFIRHPIDRAFSIYTFKRKSDPKLDSTIAAIKAKELTLAGFIRWNLERKNYNPMKNFQVIFFSDKDTNSTMSYDDLELATERMKSCAVLGVVDRMDESLVVAEVAMRSVLGNMDLSYVKQNVSAEDKSSLTMKMEKGRSQIGNELMDELESRNKLDQILYERANAELTDRIKRIDNFDEKLQQFRNRCKRFS